MRNFNEADRKKKQARIQIAENPAGLSRETLAELKGMVQAALRDGNLACAAAFKIASKEKVPKLAIGALTDTSGIRIINCQIGCFKVDKITHDNLKLDKVDEKVAAMLETLSQKDELTCAKVFELARQLKLAPMTIANVANLLNLKIKHCQLGCF